MSKDESIGTGAYLGVSLGSPYYTHERLDGYMSWAEINCRRFAFLVGDEIYAITHGVLRGRNIQSSEIIARRMGNQMIDKIKKHESQNIPCEIFRWGDLKGSEYDCLYTAATDEYESNIVFAQSVRNEVWRNLGDQLHNIGICKKGQCSHAICRRLDTYVMHEVAGLSVMSEYRGYALEVYPGPDVQVVGCVYSGDYPEIYNCLPVQKKRQFLSLKINE